MISLLILRKRSCKGFTLIELLVVIGIMAILIVVAVPSYNEYSKNQKLTEATKQLQTVLRQAQNNAQTGTVCNNGSKAAYWSIVLSTGANTFSLTPSCATGSQTTSHPLSPNVTISALNSNSCPLSDVVVWFNNISSKVTFYDSSSGCPDTTNGSLEITLSLAGSSNSKKVVVEKGGGIYVKQ